MAPTAKYLTLPAFTLTAYAGTPLYRARKIESAAEIRHPADVWEPPPAYVRSAGRLNLPGESLLYTAADPLTALHEIRLQPGEMFALFQYEVQNDFRLTSLGRRSIETKQNGFTLNEEKKLKIIQDFVEDVFTQRAEPEAAHVYMGPQIIAKEYFDLPPHLSNGWAYRSVVDPSEKALNACLRPESAHELLSLVVVTIGWCRREGDLVIAETNSTPFSRDGIKALVTFDLTARGPNSRNTIAVFSDHIAVHSNL